MAKKCCSLIDLWPDPTVFKALGEPNRARLVSFMAAGPSEMTVSEISGCCPVDLSVVSRHLAQLKQAGLVESRKQGKEVYYRLCVDSIVKILRGMADALEECCPPGKKGELK